MIVFKFIPLSKSLFFVPTVSTFLLELMNMIVQRRHKINRMMLLWINICDWWLFRFLISRCLVYVLWSLWIILLFLFVFFSLSDELSMRIGNWSIIFRWYWFILKRITVRKLRLARRKKWFCMVLWPLTICVIVRISKRI